MIPKRNEDVDTRKIRRSLTIDEARRMLNACGPRRIFYSVQLWAGLRLNETRQLEWRDVLLDDERPAIKLRVATTKSKKRLNFHFPLHPDLATVLADAKPPFARPTDRE